MVRQILLMGCLCFWAVPLQAAQSDSISILAEMDSLSRELTRLDEQIRILNEASNSLRDNLASVGQELAQQEVIVARLDSQYRILEAERQPLVSLLTRAVLADARFSRWAILDALLGSGSPSEFLGRRTAMSRLRESVQLRAKESALALREIEALEDASLTETAKLQAQRQATQELLASIAEQEEELVKHRERAIQKKLELATRQTIVNRSAVLAKEQLRQASATLDTVALAIRNSAVLESSKISFSTLKGELPWPARGSISSRFGKKRHRSLETVTENPGIDLTIAEGNPIRAVAAGQVTTVTWLRGFGNVCIVRHDSDHHTVYARLGEVLVRQDDMIDPSTIIGYPGYDPERDTYGLHFEIWSGKEKQDPLTWLAPVNRLQ